MFKVLSLRHVRLSEKRWSQNEERLLGSIVEYNFVNLDAGEIKIGGPFHRNYTNRTKKKIKYSVVRNSARSTGRATWMPT